MSRMALTELLFNNLDVVEINTKNSLQKYKELKEYGILTAQELHEINYFHSQLNKMHENYRERIKSIQTYKPINEVV